MAGSRRATPLPPQPVAHGGPALLARRVLLAPRGLASPAPLPLEGMRLSFSMTAFCALYVVDRPLSVTSSSGLAAQAPPLRGGPNRRSLTLKVRSPMAAVTPDTYLVTLCGVAAADPMPVDSRGAFARLALARRHPELTLEAALGSLGASDAAFIPSRDARCLPPYPSASGATLPRCPLSVLAPPLSLAFRFLCLALISSLFRLRFALQRRLSGPACSHPCRPVRHRRAQPHSLVGGPRPKRRMPPLLMEMAMRLLALLLLLVWLPFGGALWKGSTSPPSWWTGARYPPWLTGVPPNKRCRVLEQDRAAAPLAVAHDAGMYSDRKRLLADLAAGAVIPEGVGRGGMQRGPSPKRCRTEHPTGVPESRCESPARERRHSDDRLPPRKRLRSKTRPS